MSIEDNEVPVISSETALSPERKVCPSVRASILDPDNVRSVMLPEVTTVSGLRLYQQQLKSLILHLQLIEVKVVAAVTAKQVLVTPVTSLPLTFKVINAGNQ